MLAQYIYNVISNTPKKGGIKKFILRTALSMRKSMIKKGKDPLIDYTIGRYTIKLPISHELGYYKNLCPYYAKNLARVASMVKEKYRDMTFIDIGANVGDTIAILRNNAEFPILAIEGDARMFSILRKNSGIFQNIELVEAFVGECNDMIKGRLTTQGGTAHLEENLSGEEGIRVRTLSDILADHPGFYRSKMIKIDTDGFDCKIIRGSQEWISETRPVITFEYDPLSLEKQSDDGISIFPALFSMGYRNLILHDNLGEYMFSSTLSNTAFLEDLHEYLSGRNGDLFCDICVFHLEDTDLFKHIRQSEIRYFRVLRASQASA